MWITAQLARRVGLIRLLTRSPQLPDPWRRTREDILNALRLQPMAIATMTGDATTFP
jgi:hypothetical protein